MIELKEINLGNEIRAVFEKTGMTKTELGRRLGIPQQHVNRLFERDTMETKRLIKVSRVLECNFFALFCDFPQKIDAYLSAVNMGNGDLSYNLGDTTLTAEIEKLKAELEGAKKQIELLQDNVATLKDNLATKDQLIELMKIK